MIRLLLALVAFAAPLHVEPQVSEAPAGARTTFGFLVEHGCDDSPTVQVSIQLPEGAFDAEPVAPAGWTGVVEATTPPVVTFTGGPLPADVPETFSVALVTPNRPGETVLFPTVQTCEVGEIGWIDTEEGAEEPAPRIVLTPNADPILPPSTLDATTTTSEAPAATATSAVTTTSIDGAGDGTGGDDGDGGSALPALLAALAAGAAVVALVLRRRHRG